MKFVSKFTAIALMLGSLSSLASDKYAPGIYQIDPMHSKIEFEVPHLVISSIEGRFSKVEGQIELAEQFKKTKVQAKLDATSIDTGVEKRDEHLRSADFFNTKVYPVISFKSLSLEGSSAQFKLIGNLNIRGVTRKVTLDTKYLGTVVDGYGNEKIALHGRTKINRKDFGLTWNSMVEAGPVVGDDIIIDLKIQAARPKVKVSEK